jgi:two-component system, cell cycle sensor histidine kinase and response regulator CckA
MLSTAATSSIPLILLVDDEDDAREHLSGLFASNGFRVTPVRGCREALETARREPPDLALSSLLGQPSTSAPGTEDGVALCREWHADDRLRVVPFVLFADPADPRIAERLGADRFFARPMEPDVLIAKVREALTLRKEPAPLAVDGVDENPLVRRRRQTEKMQSLARLAGGVAHEFNNLLTVISGYTQLLLNAIDVNDNMHGLALEIDRSVERATELTRQLHLFGRKTTWPAASSDLNVLLRGLERLLQRRVGERIALHFELAEDLSRIRCDPAQVEQVLLHLAANARDAMPQGGELRMTTLNLDADESLRRGYPELAGDRFVELRVVDSGVGIAAETLPFVFEPFYTTKETGKGTGLGLAIVYGIVTHAGGLVLLDSESGRGTTIRILFPRESATAEPPPPPPLPMPGGSETILVADDDDTSRSSVVRLLGRLGYRTLSASSGCEALSQVEREQAQPPQLLITDVVMPGMSGPVLAEQMLRELPRLRVLFISGFTGDTLVSRGVVADGLGFLAKPFKATALAGRIRELLDAKCRHEV